MADDQHKHGQMDIEEQEKTFEGFIRWAIRIGVVAILIVLFLAIYAQ